MLLEAPFTEAKIRALFIAGELAFARGDAAA